MTLTLRPGTPADAGECGRIMYEAFKAIAEQHNFPPDFPSPQVATDMLSAQLLHRGFYSVVAESDGRILGSNVLDERSPIRGVGPITVDPRSQDKGVGAQLMQHLLERVARDRAPGVRLVQAGFHNRSLVLYTKLGFKVREPLSIMQGPPLGLAFPGYAVRPATRADLDACNSLCRRAHGFDRTAEVVDAIDEGTATVVARAGGVSGYATFLGFGGHAVAETNQDLMALIGAAKSFPGPGFLLPSRNHELFAWSLSSGLRLVYQMTLMSIGLYAEPETPYLPSILF
ncbi:MAG: GNAT family N-acetyltransferase [Alphaproteobacteria bacterium]|nr:GNAT family N-acetyltransferase [Alphaproteobacteria bacterium]MBV8410549.1 GNAT family N-acetyltransferase [Alphaproteobacteria bacterium]